MDKYLELKKIAENSLSSCATDIGYTAGNHHFVDLWARDSLFACFGNINSIHTKNTVNSFLKHQKPNGQIPYRIRRSKVTIKKYFGKPELLKNPNPDYRSYQSLGTVYDGGLMTIITAIEYLRESNDKEYENEIKAKLIDAIEYYLVKFKNKLISEWVLCEWADSVYKFGNVLWTNVLYLKALKSISELTNSEKYKTKYKELIREFNNKFWNGKYFSDWVDYKQQKYLAVHPNCLAIIFDIATEEQKFSIYKEMKEKCKTTFGIKSNYPKYPFWRIPLYNYVLGIPEYHNGLFWLQPWILYTYVCKLLGNTKEMYEELDKISLVIERDGEVNEIFNKDYTPVNTFFYKSEHPFAWSSGLILMLINKI